MGRKSSRRRQKIYNMKGCSKTRKYYLGGTSDIPLAYTGKLVPSMSNPFLSYTGKGGASNCGLSNPANVPVNTNASNPLYPNTGPPIRANTIYNNASTQKGGCGCGMIGGKNKSKGFMIGGVRHRYECKCSQCKNKTIHGSIRHHNLCKCNQCKNKIMHGGYSYPNGLTGSPWTPNTLPGSDSISGNHNYYPNNSYNVDVSRQMINVGANPPFLKGGKRKQRGGTLSNFMGQDLLNLGRQFQFGLGSAYNALAGYSAPVNPLPWKDQFSGRPAFNPATI